jgi:hypothetical protein
MVQDEKTIQAVTEANAAAILVNQRIPVRLFELVAKKVSHEGITVAFGPVEQLPASTEECAKDAYKAKHKDCVGADPVGTWRVSVLNSIN